MVEEKFKSLKKRYNTFTTSAMVSWLLVLVCSIAGLVLKTKDFQAVQLAITCFALLMEIMKVDTKVQSQQITIEATIELLMGLCEQDNDKEETPIVSPEDFERFKKGEMTKEEMLNIKKAVDKVTESKKDV